MVSEYPYILLESLCEDVRDPEHCYCLDQDAKILGHGCGECSKCYVEKPYEEAYKYFYDSERSLSSRSFVVVPPRSSYGLLVPSGASLKALILKGSYVTTLVSEGEEIKEGSRIAQILTRKGEFRTYRSPLEGVVIYISNMLEEDYSNVIIILAEKISLDRVEIR
ncbi:MAG: DUF2118 domain-containing protein [Sulfolobales archaeon]